jgi:hypothetical protein
MNPRSDKSALAEEDELLHCPTKELKWRESYYFNWVDLENKVSGFSTIGLVPNEHKSEFVLALFIGDQVEVHYQEPMLEELKDDVNSMLQDGKLSYKLIKPFNEWRISYMSPKLKLDLTFETRFSTFNFPTDSSGSWQHHFEASGIISGRVRNKDGTIINVNGYGQRDKSWGYRDWFKFDKWFAGQFQFKDWTAAFRKDYPGNRIDLSGYVASKEGSSLLTEMEIETVNDTNRFNTPLSSRFVFRDTGGSRHVIRSEHIGKNTYFRFARTFQGGYTELFEQMVFMKDEETGEIGSGMAEYLRTIKK